MRHLMSLLAVAVVVATMVSVCAADGLNIRIAPNTLVLGSDGTLLTVHTDVALSSVDTSSIILDGIPVSWTKADSKGNLVAKFDLNAVKAISTPPEIELTMTLTLKDGTEISGSGTIAVR